MKHADWMRENELSQSPAVAVSEAAVAPSVLRIFWVAVLAALFAAMLLVVPVAAAADDAKTAAPGMTVSNPSASANDRTAAAGYHLEDKAVYRISTAMLGADRMVLDVSGASTRVGANVQLYQKNNTMAQFWRAEYQGSGIYRFVSYTGGHLLGAEGVGLQANVSMRDSGNVDWRVAKNADGTFSLIPANASGMRLDVRHASTKNSANVWLYESNGTAAQKFYFAKQRGLTEAFAVGKTVAPDTYEIASLSNKGVCIDISGASKRSGANAQLWEKNGTIAQKFKLSYIGDGLYELRNTGSGNVLDVSGASTSPGANVWQYAANATFAQYWYVKPAGEGYQIISACNALALDTAGQRVATNTNLLVNSASSAASQRFTFVSQKPSDAPVLGTRLVRNGTYVITSALALPHVLDVAGASAANGANVWLYRSNGTAAQQFAIKHVGNNEHTIMSVNSGKYVEVAGGSTARGANVQQNAASSSKAQRWYIEQGPYGIMFRNVATGAYLDVTNAKIKSGTNIQQAEGNKSKAQCWNLKDASWRFYPTSTNLRDLSVIIKAEEYEGMPYYWGGRSPSTSFDCAGIVMYCSNQVWGTNFDLIYTNADRLYGLVEHISPSEAKVGDLVFYRGTYGSNVNYISHVVFYVGEDWTYGAGDPIKYMPIDSVKNIKKEPATYMFGRIKH